jgi:ADP-heptose:LPS heptosyltransferase
LDWKHNFGVIPTIDGILDEARVMRGLDLLISVDTCSAHLAGALGVPVWSLLPFEADWRWMQARTDTPWYPTMRLFRQRLPGDWQGVLDRVLEELQRNVASTSERLSR